MTYTKNKNGFTLVELLVALVVTGFVLAAVSTLAFALSSANKATKDQNRSQAQIRTTTMKIQEFIRNCNLICSVSDEDIAIWLSDTNNDNKINIGEICFIECGSKKDHLQLCTFSSGSDSEISLDSIGKMSTQWWSSFSDDVSCVQLLPDCRNVEFQFDKLPPLSGLVCISFDMAENEVVRHCRINAALRSRKGNLLDISGGIVTDDD